MSSLTIKSLVAKGRRAKIVQKQLDLREKLWPNLDEKRLWALRDSSGAKTKKVGFTTIPRVMPLILSIMDTLSKGKPVSSTYLELWCRVHDECVVTLNRPDEMAFHSGFRGQRATSTWRGRLQILADLGFIEVKPGPSGPLSYALLVNPYLVIKEQFKKKNLGVGEAAYNALLARATEIGADDLN